jgi:hypothetical protein
LLGKEIMIKKIASLSLVLLATCALEAGEFEYGQGTLHMKGGFIGLDQEIGTDVSTYSLVEHHKNLFSSSLFYRYNITWYDSKTMVQAQTDLNNGISLANNQGTSITIPSIDYRFQGLDLNFVLGKDLYHKDENNFFGIGIMGGVSLPWIDSEKSDSNDDSTSYDPMDLMKKSKTKMLTYKVGPTISASVSFTKYFMLYGTATYAYQTGTLSNDYIQSDLNVNGIFQEYDFGMKIEPFAYDYKADFITFSPRLYATLGYRYTKWQLDDVALDITGTQQNFTQTDFTSDNSVVYFGIGYDFF